MISQRASSLTWLAFQHSIVLKITLLWVTICWTHSSTNDFHNMSLPSWEISLSAPTNSLLSLSKMGFRRLQQRKIAQSVLRDICCKCSYQLDRTPVIIVKWNYPVLSQNAPSAIRSDSTFHYALRPTDAVIRDKWLPFSPPVRQTTHTNIKLLNNSPHNYYEYICMHLESLRVDLQNRGNIWSSPQALVLQMIILELLLIWFVNLTCDTSKYLLTTTLRGDPQSLSLTPTNQHDANHNLGFSVIHFELKVRGKNS